MKSRQTQEPVGGGHELPSEKDKLTLFARVQHKLGIDHIREIVSQEFDIDNPHYDRLVLVVYPEGMKLESGEALCVCVFYNSQFGRWPRSGGVVYELSANEDDTLNLEYFARKRIDESDPKDTYDSVQAQREATKEAGLDLVTKAELDLLQDCIDEARPLGTSL